MMTKAAVFTGVGKPFEIQYFPPQGVERGWAQVELVASGIGGNDVAILDGRIPVPEVPMILGREFIGRVSRVGGEASVREGDLVMVHMGLGEVHSCEEAPHLMGGFAERMIFPAERMTVLPEGLPPMAAVAFAGTGPVVLQSLYGMTAVRSAVVQGLGPMGLFAVLCLKRMGVENIIAITHRENELRESMARAWGAATILRTHELDHKERKRRILDLTEGQRPDLVMECSGGRTAFAEGLEYVRKGGTYLVLGQAAARGGMHLHPELITQHGLRILGYSDTPQVYDRSYLEYIAALPALWEAMTQVCDHRWSIDQINQAFYAVREGRCIKSVLVKQTDG